MNRAAAQQSIELSEGTFSLLQRSLRWSQRTAGAFDITAGPLVKAWGFTQRSARKPSPEEIAEAQNRVGYQLIELSQSQRTVRFGQEGMSINLGAIGKGDAPIG